MQTEQLTPEQLMQRSIAAFKRNGTMMDDMTEPAQVVLRRFNVKPGPKDLELLQHIISAVIVRMNVSMALLSDEDNHSDDVLLARGALVTLARTYTLLSFDKIGEALNLKGSNLHYRHKMLPGQLDRSERSRTLYASMSEQIAEVQL